MTSKILVADDSITIQKIVTMAFESEDMEILGVSNGKDAWAKLDGFDPDVVLADVDMPGLSGFDLSRKIKSSKDHQKRRVILLSSDFEDFDEQEFEVSGADDHLSKPFKSEDIVSKIHRLLSGEVPVKTLAVAEPEPTAPLEDAGVSVELSADDLIGELLEEDLAEPDPVVELTAEDMEPVVELTSADMEPVMELTAEDLAPEEAAPETEEPQDGGAFQLTDDQLMDFDPSLIPETPDSPPAAPAPVATGAEDAEPEITDESSPDFYVGERPRGAEAVEDLEDAFRSVAKSRPQPKPEPAPASSQAEGSKPDLIRETRVFLDERQGNTAPPAPAARPPADSTTPAEKLDGVMTDHALRVLEASLERSLKKELHGLTDQVRLVVRDVVREIAPEIIRSVIREEIENIRRMEEV